jgi:hypothetical protein
MREFYKFLFSEKTIKSNPTDYLHSPKTQKPLPKYLSEEDIFTLIANGDKINHRLSTLLEVLYASGMRVSELVGLPMSAISKENKHLYITGKGQKERIVPLNEKACEPLKKFSSVTVVDCSKADTSLIIKWIKAECMKENVTIDGETAGLIGEFCSSDMTRIEGETKKLIAYVGEGGVIDKQAVKDMVSKDTEYKIYEMTDYIGKHKFDKALEIIGDMLSKGEPHARIITSLYNYFRRLLHAAISGLTSNELATAFGVKEFAARKTKEQSAMFKKRALKSAVDFLTDVDYKIKSGQIAADEGMWVSLFRIITGK